MNRRTNPLSNCPEILGAINVVKFLVQIDKEGGTFLQGSLKVAVCGSFSGDFARIYLRGYRDPAGCGKKCVGGGRMKTGSSVRRDEARVIFRQYAEVLPWNFGRRKVKC